MRQEKAIHALDGGRIMAEYGPMRLIISAWLGKVPQRDLCISASRMAFTYLERIAALRATLSRPLARHQAHIEDPVARAMIESVLAVGDEDLTPLAAVAGSLADAVADYMFVRGMSRVVVNNGGDVAVRIRGADQVRVGVAASGRPARPSHTIVLDSSSPSWGVATSGLGGRSFTRGVASAVTVLARNASLADAAATAVANASFVEDNNVIRRKAGEIDPATDIPDLMVTVRVGPLSQETRSRAIAMALDRAERLVKQKTILGASINVGGQSTSTAFFRDHLCQ